MLTSRISRTSLTSTLELALESIVKLIPDAILRGTKFGKINSNKKFSQPCVTAVTGPCNRDLCKFGAENPQNTNCNQLKCEKKPTILKVSFFY